MASKAGAVAERRLRPLWDAIDTRQYKTALKLASGLQAKHPDSPYLLALKALATERIGKPDEALLLCNQARALLPVDELTLNTLQIVYSRLHLLEETTACYEYACSKVTNNVELLMELFKCYVRQRLFVKQQQVAMRMYKQIGEERYLLWAVCSILMQVGSEKESNGKLIALAEAFLRKRLETNGLQDLEALMLYISVLQQQKKYDRALEVLSGNLGDLFSIQSDKLRLQGELLMCLQQYEKAAEVFEQILKISSDDWGVFLSYLDASFAGVNWVDHPPDSACSQIDENLEKVVHLVKELQGMRVEELRRGPFLAMSEIEKKRLTLKQKYCKALLPEDQSGPLIACILDYYDKFGHLSSFSSDVSAYVDQIDENNKLQLSTALFDASGRDTDSKLVNQLRRNISAYQMDERLGVKLKFSSEGLVSHAVDISKLYLEGLKLAVDLDAQETMNDGEELLVLCANILVEVFRRSQHVGYLLEAILILEFGLLARRFNSRYKLLLVDLYSALSAIVPALNWFRSLDVKFILIESLSHLILPGLLGSTCWADLQKVLKDALKFYEVHELECAELAILAYQRCTYSKVLEFVDFRKRLRSSHQHLLFKVETAVLQIKQKADKLEEFEFELAGQEFGKITAQWSSDECMSSLSFNEDLQVRPWWSPTPKRSYLSGSLRLIDAEAVWHHVESQDERVSRESMWRSSLRRRCLLPRLLFLMLDSIKRLVHVDENDSVSTMHEFKGVLEDFLQTLGVHFEDVETWLLDVGCSRKVFEDCQMSPVEVASFAMLWASYQMAINIENRNKEVLSLVVRVMDNIVRESLRELKASLADNCGGKPIFEVMTPGSTIAILVGLTSESFAWVGLYLQAWAKRMQPVSKKKKKKGAGATDHSDNVATTLPLDLETFRSASIRPLAELSAFLSDCLSRPAHSEVHTLLSLLSQNSEDSSKTPGSVLAVLIDKVSKVGAPSLGIKQPWSTEKYIRDIVDSRWAAVAGIQDLCLTRLTIIKSLKF